MEDIDAMQSSSLKVGEDKFLEKDRIYESATKRKSRTADRHKRVQCKVCLREMRSNNLKRHRKTHGKIHTLDEEEMRDEIKRRKKLHKTREEREKLMKKIIEEESLPLECVHENELDSNSLIRLEKEMEEDDTAYEKKLQRGKDVCNIMGKRGFRQESLSRNNMEALTSYRKQKPERKLDNVELRPWQQTLMNEMTSSSSDREIWWIIGKNGDEGKTWFQDYLEDLYGYDRVVQLTADLRTKDLLRALTKRPLATIDIFLFNLPRAVNSCNYYILESLKDGKAVSSKYDNEILRFKIPNIVAVFSIDMPEWEKVSFDRWKAFRIENNQLIKIDV